MDDINTTGSLQSFNEIKDFDDFKKQVSFYIKIYNEWTNDYADYYIKNGYVNYKNVYGFDEIDFCKHELRTLNDILKTIEKGLLYLYDDLRLVPFREVHKEPKSFFDDTIGNKEIRKLILIYSEALRVKEFLVTKIKSLPSRFKDKYLHFGSLVARGLIQFKNYHYLFNGDEYTSAKALGRKIKCTDQYINDTFNDTKAKSIYTKVRYKKIIEYCEAKNHKVLTDFAEKHKEFISKKS